MMNPTRALIFSTAAFLLTATLSAGVHQAPSQTSDEHPEFPPGDGRELTMKVCSQCHELNVIAEQALDEDGWKNMVEQMASMGATATEAQLDQIVKYLVKAFPAK